MRRTMTRRKSGQLRPLRGFDRLAASGFTAEDIANIRRQFHSQQDTDYLDTEEFETEEACKTSRLAISFILLNV
jgi:hypothetical protein